MRGVILAGGTGSRLGDVTAVVNKHLLLVGGRPMIRWPIQTLRANGIDDITIVSSPRGVGQLAELLGGDYTYRVQDRPGGIAQAIACAADHSGRDVAVILGDNVFLPPPKIPPRTAYPHATVFLKEVAADRLCEFGVPTFDRCGGVIRYVTEKPADPASIYAVTGLYVFAPNVFYKVTDLSPSERGEVEITSLLNLYADKGSLGHVVVDGFWGDAGTPFGMAECGAAIALRGGA